MSQKVAFFNPKPHVVYIGGQGIPPNETREIDARHHPDYQRPATASTPEPDLLETLLEKKVDAIEAELDNLDDEQLARLDLLEQAQKKPRKTLIESIARLQLERAQAASEMEQFAEQIKNAAADELGELAVLHADNPQLLGLIDAELASRPLGGAS